MTCSDVVARTIELEGDANVSLEAVASGSDEPGAVATLEITATNTGRSRYVVSSGPPQPFGVLVASERGTPGNTFTLWSDRYSECEHVTVDGRRIVERRKLVVATALDPGELLSERYTIYDTTGGSDHAADPNPAGTYLLRDADGEAFSVGGYGVELTIAE